MESGQGLHRESHHITRRMALAAGLAAVGSAILGTLEQTTYPTQNPADVPPLPSPSRSTSSTPAVPTPPETTPVAPTSPETSTVAPPTTTIASETSTPAPTTPATPEPAPATSTTSAVPRGAPNFAPKNIRRHLPADRFIQRGPTGAPNVSITIDDFFGRDGADYLSGLLDVGKRYDVPFTLFPTGYALDTHNRLGYRDLWRRAADEGHVIGNHTYHHYIRPDRPYKYFAGLRPGEIHDELEFTRQSLHHVLGYDYATYLMRPPGGSGGYPSNRKDHAYALGQVAQEGYYMTMWTTDSNASDGRIVTKNQDERFLDKVFTDKNESARNGSIILLHPTTLSINGVKKLISGLHDRGFDCRTVPGMFM